MEDKTVETVKALKAHLALNVKSVEQWTILLSPDG